MESDTIIFDGSNSAHRLSAASAPLTNAKGERVEVVFGLLRLISSVMRRNPTKRCYLVWDGKHSRALRQSIDPEYKNNRERTQDEEFKERIQGMHLQVERFWELFGQFLPIHWYSSQRFEADDIIAMLAHEGTDQKLIVSGDRDMLQLVNSHISVYSPIPDKFCREDNFQEYTRGFPDGLSWLAAKCLMGDTSDHVKGVGGVGEKTALKILSAHGWDLCNLQLAPTAELIKSKVGQHVISDSGWSRIKLNYTLMSLHGRVHYRMSSNVEQRTGRLNITTLRTNLAKMQFASIMASFNQFISPFQRLEK